MCNGIVTESGKGQFAGGSLLNGSRHPLFTVITAVYNGADHLEATILSVLGQEFGDVEFIIIDGGSKDATLDILRKYENSAYWVSEPDQGVYDAFNKACHLISGRWAIFLGAGDVLHDCHVLKSMAEVVSNVSSETEIVYGKVNLTNTAGRPIATLNSPWNQMKGRWSGGRPMLPHHQGVFHRDRILQMGRPFDTSYRIAADSKLLYSSIQRTQPVFSDIVVASASVGGVSTDVKHSKAVATEILRINREFGFTNYSHQLWFHSKAAVKGMIRDLMGERISRVCIDEYRKLTGRERLRAR